MEDSSQSANHLEIMPTADLILADIPNWFVLKVFVFNLNSTSLKNIYFGYELTWTLLLMAPYVRMAPWKAFVEHEMLRRFKVGIGWGPTANVNNRVCLVNELLVIISTCSAGNSVPPSLMMTTAKWQLLLLPESVDLLVRLSSNCPKNSTKQNV